MTRVSPVRPEKSRSPPAEPVILLVEDEILMRETVGEFLRDSGYQVMEAASGAQALTMLGSQDVAVDLVCSDVVMPGAVNGYDLAQWVQVNRPDLPVLLTSGFAGSVQPANGSPYRGPLLSKPYTFSIVVERIRQMLGRGRVLT